jgi:hypothetical protein
MSAPADAGKLPFSETDDDWRWRWMQFPHGRTAVLHRIARVDVKHDNGAVGVDGATVCGRAGRLDMPGVCSRIAAPRCKQCCKALGVPLGDGAPYNKLPLAVAEAEGRMTHQRGGDVG